MSGTNAESAGPVVFSPERPPVPESHKQHPAPNETLKENLSPVSTIQDTNYEGPKRTWRELLAKEDHWKFYCFEEDIASDALGKGLEGKVEGVQAYVGLATTKPAKVQWKEMCLVPSAPNWPSPGQIEIWDQRWDYVGDAMNIGRPPPEAGEPGVRLFTKEARDVFLQENKTRKEKIEEYKLVVWNKIFKKEMKKSLDAIMDKRQTR
ncbi:hypothetical protein F5Y17DRAFT_477190 [Xylariaceae sp. FL0594]|nr:hypothetical protein F5Y17DRAFT_477190 [Xylariaceae sp. FL0594]